MMPKAIIFARESLSQQEEEKIGFWFFRGIYYSYNWEEIVAGL